MTIQTANRLYELRKKHGLSQEELAEKLGVSRQAVSKWERSEASPDTDNLIALAKIYGLSLDELIFGEKTTEQTKATEDNRASSEGPVLIKKGENRSHQRTGEKYILVESEDGDRVKIGLNGIKIESSNSDDNDASLDEDDDLDDVIIKDGHFHIEIDKPKNKVKFWLEVPYAIICTIAYLVFGFTNICGGWALSWIIFITIPIYYSLVEAIYKKKLSEFAYPVLTAFAYLYMGLYHGNWHPSWIVFITIPVYYPIAEAIDRKIRERAQAKADQDKQST